MCATPRFRVLEVFPVEQDDERILALGDPARLTDQVAVSPPVLLDLVSRVDGEHSVTEIAHDPGRRRICGLSPTCTFPRALPGVTGRLLRYRQWPDPRGAVSLRAAAVP